MLRALYRGLYPCQFAAIKNIVHTREYEHKRIIFDIRCTVVGKIVRSDFEIGDGIRAHGHRQNKSIAAALVKLCENCEYKNKVETTCSIVEKQEK